MTAVVFAYHDVGCRGIRVLRRLGVEIAEVYTHDDDPTENVWFDSVGKTCAELGLQVRAGVDWKDPSEQARLRGCIRGLAGPTLACGVGSNDHDSPIALLEHDWGDGAKAVTGSGEIGPDHRLPLLGPALPVAPGTRR